MGDVTAPQAPPAQGPKGQAFLRDLLRRLIRERPVGAVSAAIVLLLCLVAIFADVLAPFHYMDMTMVDRLQGPSSTYPLGTDHIGRDVFSRLLYGARVSLAVGFAATTLSVVVSLLIGGVAGFVGGKLDLAVQRLVDAWMSFPGLLLLLTFMTLHDYHRPGHPADHRHQLAGGARGGDRHQGQPLLRGGARHRQSVVADAAAPRVAEHHGADHHHLLDHDWLGDHRGGELELPGLRAAAGRTELGHHAEPRGAAVHGDSAAAGDVAGVALTLVVYCLNIVGDALRDLLDPRLRGGGGALAGGVGTRAAERATKALQKLERSR